MIVSTYNNSNCYGLGVVAPLLQLLLMWIDDAWEVDPGAWHGAGVDAAVVVQIVVEVAVVANEVAEVVLDAVEIH